ncbi:porin family protein [Spirosoma utsteinense]|uniref:Outer membrane protein beta-barrel domain-containing protein n=1 Tax=Spirosoma utsteinense TaxID=2585773 RepID=A0ABR6WD41_9BACT|nr:porin family protein [Spirosoma utsteinense]MBC3788427.1 hypothetical protein [Spirosoma utsteinense]MBC3794482.1 hypothetical protein [Spirosoma utsteinense]
MKSLLILLVVNTFIMSVAQSQTRPATRSATKPTGRVTTTAPVQSPGQPAVTRTTSTSAAPNRQQELYDQYHSVTKKPATTITNAPVAQSTIPAKQPTLSDGRTARVRIGVRGGVSYLVFLENEFNADPTVGFVGGFVATIGQGTLSFQPEFNYARYAFTVETPVLNSTNTVALNRFELPLLLKISSGSANSTRFFLNVGPYGAYSSSSSINGQNVSLDGTANRFSYGAATGVGVAVKAGPGHLTLELRGLYQLGDTDSGFNTDSRTINTQATVGYMIPLGRR